MQKDDAVRKILDQQSKKAPSEDFAAFTVFRFIDKQHEEFEQIVRSVDVGKLHAFFINAYSNFINNPETVGFTSALINKNNNDTSPAKWNTDIFKLKNGDYAALLFMPIQQDTLAARIVGVILGGEGEGNYYCMLNKNERTPSSVIRRTEDNKIEKIGEVNGLGFELMQHYLACIEKNYYHDVIDKQDESNKIACNKSNMGYFYEVNKNREIEIYRYQGDEEKVVIPEHIDDLPVVTIQKHAFASGEMTEIIIPEGVKTICSEAFVMCENLERVSLPASLEELGRGVFMGSEKLKEISFPNGNVKYSVENGFLYNSAERILVFCPPGLKLESVLVPMDTEIIAHAAFYANRFLKRVQLPITLKKIESEAFLFTDSLRMIELPPYIEQIEPGCFLVGNGPYAEKQFEIYAFQKSVGYQYAVENQIRVHPLYAILTG